MVDEFDGSASSEGISVDTSFDSECVVLDGDIDEKINSVKYHKTSDRLGLPPQADEIPTDLDNVRDLGDIPGYILKMWLSLERKLDTLLQFASAESRHLDGGQLCKIVNISKNGLTFKPDGDSLSQTFFLIRVSPPTFPPFSIDVVVEVEANQKADAKDCYKTIFKAINEDDRELLITYIFKRQREILRMKMEDDLDEN